MWGLAGQLRAVEAGRGGRFGPKASASPSEDVNNYGVTPISSDGAQLPRLPCHKTTSPRKPFSSHAAFHQVRIDSCSDEESEDVPSGLRSVRKCTQTSVAKVPFYGHIELWKSLFTWHLASWWLSGFISQRKKQQMDTKRQWEISVTGCMECDVSSSALAF